MKASPWLREFHRQWQANRGRKVQPSQTTFWRPWKELLEASSLKSAAEESHAVHEAETCERAGHLILKRHRYRRYIIESVGLPVSAASWLVALFEGTAAQTLCDQARELVRQAGETPHPRWPESWQRLCETLLAAFAEGKNLAPFFWHKPADLSVLLTALHGLTAREWTPHTLVREASTALGFDSKFLERKAASLETALGRLFGEETSLESLGLSRSQSLATAHGPLTLHFPDGSAQSFAHLHGQYSISLADLLRASHATTSAARILTIENRKTTFPQAIGCNANGEALLIASSYPTSATRRLLELLPSSQPHFHFGDTDPSGYAILRSLREFGFRPVQPFLMAWQEDEQSPPLSEHDRRLLPSLLNSPLLADCRLHLIALHASGRKGRFEQESHGAPSLPHWPFWAAAHAFCETSPPVQG